MVFCLIEIAVGMIGAVVSVCLCIICLMQMQIITYNAGQSYWNGIGVYSFCMWFKFKHHIICTLYKHKTKQKLFFSCYSMFKKFRYYVRDFFLERRAIVLTCIPIWWSFRLIVTDTQNTLSALKRHSLSIQLLRFENLNDSIANSLSVWTRNSISSMHAWLWDSILFYSDHVEKFRR